jgi:SOS-response transcriptional repressor LexA
MTTQRRTITRANALYHHIHGFIETNGRPPTVRDVADLLGVTSTATARHYLGVLKDWRWVTWNTREVRTLRLTRTTETIHIIERGR